MHRFSREDIFIPPDFWKLGNVWPGTCSLSLIILLENFCSFLSWYHGSIKRSAVVPCQPLVLLNVNIILPYLSISPVEEEACCCATVFSVSNSILALIIFLVIIVVFSFT